MQPVATIYPATPQNIDISVIQPSPAFKQEVSKVLFAIVFFILTYLALMAAAITLACFCVIGGFMLVVNFPRLFTIMIGIGLIGLGFLVVFFLLKFLFKINKVDRSHLIQITEADQPELFNFINTLTRETQSPFPKKIYLSANVNASVFYDSSFWSMFFPIRKNLQIGLGLVNSVNISEFKAILAHEFGHFSQRSMKLGSYVYNVNQIIYNMLYDNEGYGDTLQTFANLNSYFAFFAILTAKIVSGIQWILQKVYAVVNKSYMSLSRQMEFHADSVAAHVAGADHLITSLRRLEVADSCYDKLFQFYNLWYKQNLKPDNLYPQHSEMMMQFALDHGIPLENRLPQVNAQTFAHYNRARIVIKDQWASHPSTDDRESHLNSLNIHTDAIKTSAWCVFKDAEALQKLLTDKIYGNVEFKEKPRTFDFTFFRQQYHLEVEKYQLNKRYKGFFNSRNLSVVDLRKLEDKIDSEKTLDSILNESILVLPYEIDGLNTDLTTLAQIQAGSFVAKSFDFNGEKCDKSDVSRLINQLNDELRSARAQLVDVDSQIIACFLHAANRRGEMEGLRQEYSNLFLMIQKCEEDLKKSDSLLQEINPIYYGGLEASGIEQIMESVKILEVPIKERLEQLIADPLYSAHFAADERDKVEQFLTKKFIYFVEQDFNQDAVALLNECIGIYQRVINAVLFNEKKSLLESQLRFLP